MRFATALTILGCIALAQAARGEDPKGEAKPEAFSVESMFSVDTPPGGFEWAEVRKIEAGGVKGRVCVCTKQGSTARVVLTIEERTAKSDQARIAAIKGHYNGLVQTLNDAGFTGLKGTKPDIEAPIPNRASFIMSAKNAEGTPSFINSVTIFGKNTYLLQVFAESKAEVNLLAKVVKSLKEPKQEKPKQGAE